MRRSAALLLWLALAWPAVAQDPPVPDVKPASAPADRDVSWRKLVPNILSDQKRIWLFPLKLGQAPYAIPTAAVVGTDVGLVALDPYTAPHFRRTTSFDGFNRVFSSGNTNNGMIAAPVALYLIGLLRKDSWMQKTALLAGEAVADSEILTTVMKDTTRRLRPVEIPPYGNFCDTWFQEKGPWIRGKGSTPSGHTIAAFSVATVVARRYGKQHRWVPWVAYGLAGAVGFSRVSLSAHFVSDVFLGGALGYSISRFTVLRQ